jgi:hypothetical protein
MREVNERLRALVDGRAGLPGDEVHNRLEFLCECSNADCIESIPLSLTEYDTARDASAVFLVVPGHETPEDESTIEENERFFLIEKSAFAQLAEESDPRSD